MPWEKVKYSGSSSIKLSPESSVTDKYPELVDGRIYEVIDEREIDGNQSKYKLLNHKGWFNSIFFDKV